MDLRSQKMGNKLEIVDLSSGLLVNRTGLSLPRNSGPSQVGQTISLV